MLLQDRTCMEELFASLGKPLVTLYEEDEMNKAINYALLLEDNEQKILTLKKYTLSDILYGRYYWFIEFLVQYEKLYGKDAGMEQQQFMIIVAMDYAGCVDCSLLEKIEQEAAGTFFRKGRNLIRNESKKGTRRNILL